LAPWINVHHLLRCPAELQVDEEENDAHKETNAANHDIGNSQEWILATKDASGGYDHTFGSLKLCHLKVVTNFQSV
jgi:hypothetical protein